MTLALTSTCVGGRRAGIVQQFTSFRVARLGLTEQQTKTIEAVIEHGSSKKAAAALGISPKTVEGHIGNAYRKVGVCHISQLVAIYVTAKLKDQ